MNPKLLLSKRWVGDKMEFALELHPDSLKDLTDEDRDKLNEKLRDESQRAMKAVVANLTGLPETERGEHA